MLLRPRGVRLGMRLPGVSGHAREGSSTRSSMRLGSGHCWPDHLFLTSSCLAKLMARQGHGSLCRVPGFRPGAHCFSDSGLESEGDTATWRLKCRPNSPKSLVWALGHQPNEQGINLKQKSFLGSAPREAHRDVGDGQSWIQLPLSPLAPKNEQHQKATFWSSAGLTINPPLHSTQQ